MAVTIREACENSGGFGTLALTGISPLLPTSLDHFLVLDKPFGVSSAAALNRLKRSLPRGTKLGHAGTLDPLATGVLVCLLGRATKRSDHVMGLGKTYEATVRLGATSATDDAEGPIEPTDESTLAPVRGRLAVDPVAARGEVERALVPFVGTIEQMPPAFSALKVAGRRACDRVRDGQAVVLKARPVRIDRIEVLSFDWPDLRIRVDCGKGTYIRSLARDVGAALGAGGYLAGLVRSRVGPFTLDRAATLAALQERGVEPFLIPSGDV